MHSQERQRTPSLSAWLVLLAIGNGFSAILYSIMWIALLVLKSRADSVAVIGIQLPILAVASFAALVFIYAVYKWKRWGVYGFAITSLLVFGINLKMGTSNLVALFGLLGIGVLVYLIKPYWNQFDTF